MKLAHNIGIFLYLPKCIKFIKSCPTNIKILCAIQEDVRSYGSNLVYSIKFQVNVWYRLDETIFSVLLFVLRKT